MNTLMPKMNALPPEINKTIPVINHILPDDDLNIHHAQKYLNKIIKLLTDQHSGHLYERHINSMMKIAKFYVDGYLLKDLVVIFRILNICADRVQKTPAYIPAILAVLKPCSLPFLQQKSSDHMVYKQIAREAISQLGFLLRVNSEEIRESICNILISFYVGSKRCGKIMNSLKTTEQKFNQTIVQESDISATLVKSLALFRDNATMRLQVLNVLRLFSKDSAENCNKMLDEHLPLLICERINEEKSAGLLMFHSAELLWNILENGDSKMAAEQLSNVTCISALWQAFLTQLTSGYSHYDMQLRNDLLVVLTLVASFSKQISKVPYVECGVVKQLVAICTFQEVKSHNSLVKHLKLTKSCEDFELKKLLLNFLITLANDSTVLPIYKEGHVLLALLTFVRANERLSKPATSSQWTESEFEELQLHALSSLVTLAPKLADDYVTCQGSTRLLLLLEWCVSNADDYGGDGNSFHGNGGRGNKRAQMRQCLRLIQIMASTGDQHIHADLTDQGAIHQFTGILKILQEKQDKDEFDVEIQTSMFFILSILCEKDLHRKELYGEEGVDILVYCLRMNIDLLTSGQGHQLLLLSVIDAIWCCVVGCYSNEDYFFEKEGIFLLIDLLEKAPHSMHCQVLGCLLDLSENTKCLAHVTAWKGSDGVVTSAHLFCDLWRREEKHIGVQRDANGSILDTSRPLLTTVQEAAECVALPSHQPSQSIVDVSENLRAKIYTLFGKIGFTDLLGLSTEDHVTLTIIEHYLDFKLGEVWTEIGQELQLQDIRPITPDRDAMMAIERTVEDRSKHVKQIQEDLVESQRQHDLIDEQEFYAHIKDNHKQHERLVECFTDYIARTSNYEYLKEAKERQEFSIDASRSIPQKDGTLTFEHSTKLDNINTTTFSRRYLKIQSTPADITGGALLHYDPLSGTIKKTIQFNC